MIKEDQDLWQLCQRGCSSVKARNAEGLKEQISTGILIIGLFKTYKGEKSVMKEGRKEGR